MPETDEPDNEPPWWSLGKARADGQADAPPPVPPAVHITVNQPQPTDIRTPHRRSRARRWFLIHGAGAGVGYTFGLYHSIAAFLNTIGPGAPAAGLCLAGFGWFAAEFATERYQRFLPPRTRPPVIWALRIPFSTALLAVALHAPNALI
jgi:hypothetical protein